MANIKDDDERTGVGEELEVPGEVIPVGNDPAFAAFAAFRDPENSDSDDSDVDDDGDDIN